MYCICFLDAAAEAHWLPTQPGQVRLMNGIIMLSMCFQVPRRQAPLPPLPSLELRYAPCYSQEAQEGGYLAHMLGTKSTGQSEKGDYYYYLKNSALQGQQRVNALYQPEDPNPTKQTLGRKKKKVKDKIGESSSGQQ